MSRVCVAIPVYKHNPSNRELQSLFQCRNVLHNFKMVLFCSETFNPAIYSNINADDIKRFPDHYFNSLNNYSTLMLAPEFYKAFEEYEYILIYQPDCWVFRDELNFWCDMGYDYIGAPFLNLDNYNSWKYRFIPGLRKFTAKVGNGGFTLRRVEKHIKCAHRYSFLNKFFRLNEDQFWSSFVSRLDKNYNVPDANIALRFAFDRLPKEAFEMNQKKLPFGCHAWPIYYNKFWHRYIKIL